MLENGSIEALKRLGELQARAIREGSAQDEQFIAKVDKLGRVRYTILADDYDVYGKRSSWGYVFVAMKREAEAA